MFFGKVIAFGNRLNNDTTFLFGLKVWHQLYWKMPLALVYAAPIALCRALFMSLARPSNWSPWIRPSYIHCLLHRQLQHVLHAGHVQSWHCSIIYRLMFSNIRNGCIYL